MKRVVVLSRPLKSVQVMLKNSVDVMLVLSDTNAFFELRKHETKQPELLQQRNSIRGVGGVNDFYKFITHAFLCNVFNPLGIGFNSALSIFLNNKSQYCSKTYCAHHAQSILRKALFGVANRPHQLIFNIFF